MRYVVDRDDPRVIEAASLAAAVEAYVHEADDEGWSDRFDVLARAEDDDRWTIFSVTTRTEVIRAIGRASQGPAVDSDDIAAVSP